MEEPNIIKLDIRGQICPSCLLRALKEVNQHATALRNGTCRIVVETDDRQATNTIPETVTKMGYRVDVENNERGYRITIGASPHSHKP